MIPRWKAIALCALAAATTPIVALAQTSDAVAAPPAARDELTGDWGGARSGFEERGIEPGIVITQDVMRVARGGIERRTVAPGLVEPTIAFDLDRLAGLEGTTAFVRGIGTYGRDPGEAAGSLNAPSNLANELSTFKLIEAWVERAFFDERLSLRVGLYSADAEFDVKETAGVFMNGGFGTGVDLSQSGVGGPCAFPTSCVGARLRLQATPAHYVQLALLDGVAGDPDKARGTQIRLARDEGALVLAEAGWQQGADVGRFVRWAVGAWHYTSRFDDVSAVDGDGNPLRRRGNQGLYALLEGELYREPGQVTQGLSGFVRIGVADRRVNPVDQYASAGLAYTGLIPGRDEDVTGIGVSVPIVGSRYRDAMRAAGTPVAAHEAAFELAHRMQLLPWLSLQLDAQYITHPGADPTLAAARLLGLRCQVTF